MDHNLLRSLMLESHDLRMTSTQAGELVAEFNRIQSMLDEAQSNNTELNDEIRQLKKTAIRSKRKSKSVFQLYGEGKNKGSAS